jgi:hypothetical protein
VREITHPTSDGSAYSAADRMKYFDLQMSECSNTVRVLWAPKDGVLDGWVDASVYEKGSLQFIRTWSTYVGDDIPKDFIDGGALE